jgi:membrane-associated phospholipid phosphatase
METRSSHPCWRWWHVALLTVIALLALAPCDIPIARFCYSYPLPRSGFRAIEIGANMAGTGLGALLIAVIAVMFDRRKWARLPLLVSATLGAGLMADVVKLCISRGRPHSVDLSTATFSSTFHGLFPVLSAGSSGQSFPSGHAATAAGLAVGLSMLYPRGRWLFVLFAVGVALARVVVHAHFPTDAVAGAALGGAWAWTCHRGFLAPAFARSERMLQNKFASQNDGTRTRTAMRSDTMQSPSSPRDTSQSDLDQRSVA